ncbi:YtpR family tRNA-binding protein [Mammaliicoccus vitulinus]|uniref:YtpR family tRNA-binding protein n=1 Tax=Mammaliicoccus vitulinus TaxID=71237 RepID=UPI003B9F58A8
MNLFYNKNGVGDVLMVTIDPVTEGLVYEYKNDITIIKSESNVVGFNIFNASKYVQLEGNGNIKVQEKHINSIQDLLEKNHIDYKLEADLSPKFVVGYVTEKSKHPDADKLSVCQVDVGNQTLQIVCGAPNIDQDQKVVVAKVGAVMPSGMVIKDAELRGVPSSGMICSMKELDLEGAPNEKGIMVLEDSYTVGTPFFEDER